MPTQRPYLRLLENFPEPDGEETTSPGNPTSDVDRFVQALRLSEPPDDGAFDRHLPHDLRQASREFWTPLQVIAVVADWIDHLQIRSVVDLGSGVGKFAVATAVVSSCKVKVIGIEHRPRLVAVARSLARTFDVEHRVQFVEGALRDVAIPRADAYYMFNPFSENLFGPELQLDQSVELSEDRYHRDVEAVEALLDAAPIGTYVIAYNGFGGAVPRGYRDVKLEYGLSKSLRIAQKRGL